MRINNNIQALNAYRNLYQNQSATSKNLEKLSSGLRINRAADDAAGLAISEKMRSQIRGLKQAERNSMDGISLMQTTEGAMTEVHSMLQRMRELSVQGANDTNTDADRAEIQKEIDQLLLEIDSIAEKTEFNTRKLLNGESAVLSVIDSDNIGLVKTPTVVDPSLKSGNYELGVELDTTTPDAHFQYKVTQPAAGLKQGDIEFNTNVPNQKFGEYTINIRDYSDDGTNTSAKIQVIGPDGLPINQTPLSVAVGEDVPAGNRYVTVGGLQIDASKIDRAGTVKINIEAKVTLTLSYDQNLESESITSASIEGQKIKMPTYNLDKEKVLVGDIPGVTGGTANINMTDNFPTGTTSVEVIDKVNVTDKDEVIDDLLADGIKYYTAETTSGEKILFTLSTDNTIAPDTEEYNFATRTIKFLEDTEVSLKDIEEKLATEGYHNIQAWGVKDNVDEIEDGMLVVASGTDGGVAFANPYEVDMTDYQPVDFKKTVTTVNGKVTHGGVEFNLDSSLEAGFSEFAVTNNSLFFQIGPNTNQSVNIDVPQLNTVELGIETIDVTSQEGANKAIFALDQAIQKVSSIRSKLGATQNRLEHTISNIQVTHENLTSAESRIRDADMALEMTEFTKNNILNQSAQAMLAQANQLPQGVLQLLQG